ncbi:UrcA family protein [Sphingomonas hankookensis]|uniref:UrcA family protein n=1 Tax=Sphingomonas hengshuiensis TaxID=1609977 RepID=A0A2W4ZAU8_9SPHN|nr:MAG: hypothetical protein DI632_05950 [Sphingomonas hengshuiensis]
MLPLSVRRLSLALGAAGALLAAAPAACAEDVANIAMTASDAEGRVVRTVAIDLAGVRDNRTIGRRLMAGARDVCGYSSMWGLRPRADYVRCETAALAGARAQIAARAARG